MHATETSTKEFEGRTVNGWLMLLVVVLLAVGIYYCFSTFIESASPGHGSGIPEGSGKWIVAGVVLTLAEILTLPGFFTLQPNEARVLILFGAYKGSVRKPGLHWANPFYANGAAVQPATTGENKARVNISFTRYKISLRVRNFNTDRMKVNDKRGNPIEIAAVVVWHVSDTAQATFDVDNYESYVRVQSESAIRHMASTYAYDNGEDNELTLRSSVDEVSASLSDQLQQRLGKAGVAVDEARLTHLAYAPEIAQAMLRRQQAEAVIAARQKIVHGAVSMVDMALRELNERHVVQLDDERKASMVSNLMVVLCSESEVHPVINAGTLYT